MGPTGRDTGAMFQDPQNPNPFEFPDLGPEAASCPACQAPLPEGARFCAACGNPVPVLAEADGRDRSITAPEVRPGQWAWLLILLIAVERALAWYAFPLEGPMLQVQPWERPFLTYWSLAGLLPAGLLLVRNRVGGFLALLSSLALLVRACIPLLGEKPAGEAVVVLMVVSASLTFWFFFEQSFWPKETA